MRLASRCVCHHWVPWYPWCEWGRLQGHVTLIPGHSDAAGPGIAFSDQLLRRGGGQPLHDKGKGRICFIPRVCWVICRDKSQAESMSLQWNGAWQRQNAEEEEMRGPSRLCLKDERCKDKSPPSRRPQLPAAPSELWAATEMTLFSNWSLWMWYLTWRKRKERCDRTRVLPCPGEESTLFR